MAHLQLPAVVTTETQEELKGAFAILEEVQQTMEKYGLPELRRPENEPPTLADLDIGSSSNRELETLLCAYTGWAQYLAPKLAKLEASYKISASNMKRVTATLLTTMEGPRATAMARVREHPVYVEHDLEHLKLFATKEILDAYYNAFNRQYAAISRVIEIRKIEFEQHNRQTGVQSHRQGPSAPQGSFARPRRPA